MIPYFIDPNVETYDALLRGDPEETKSENPSSTPICPFLK